jgi:V8-like Glu-specific endopeptidase
MKKIGRLCSLSLAALAAACSSEDGTRTDTTEADGEAVAVSVEPIIGATVAVAYPEAAILDIDRGTSGTWYACSATLIAPRVVLTAGHCVDGHKQWKVYVQNEWQNGERRTERSLSSVLAVRSAFHHRYLVHLDRHDRAIA